MKDNKTELESDRVGCYFRNGVQRMWAQSSQLNEQMEVSE